jgi:hypothetical protein
MMHHTAQQYITPVSHKHKHVQQLLHTVLRIYLWLGDVKYYRCMSSILRAKNAAVGGNNLW